MQEKFVFSWEDELFPHEKYRIAPDVSQNYASFYISPRLKFETYFPTKVTMNT